MNYLQSKDPPLANLEDFKSWILYEDEHVLVVDKPGWLVCHPSKNGPFSSLVGCSKAYLETQSIHLASRLDRETSGAVLLAKNRKAASYWQKGVEQKLVRRHYLAIMDGKIDELRKVSTFLGNDPESKVFVKQRVTEGSRKAKHAETLFSPLACREGYTLCSVATLTGRKHQIRVHAQWIGCPLVGEKLYGADESIYLDFCSNGWSEEWAKVLEMDRQALHGRCLIDLNSRNEFLAPLPHDILFFLTSKMKLGKEEIDGLIKQADDDFRSFALAN